MYYTIVCNNNIIIPCYLVYYGHGGKFSCSYNFSTYLGVSITLSPLGMVSVCPGGQVLLTCERMSGAILYWNVSVPHPMATFREIIVTSQGVLLASEFRIGFTEFNVTLITSDNPPISQLLINNVTTEINGSTIYCSEDGDENGAPAVAVNVINKSMTELTD